MLVDDPHHHFGRRSSSAWAKYADAFRRSRSLAEALDSLARASSADPALRSSGPAAPAGPAHPGEPTSAAPPPHSRSSPRSTGSPPTAMRGPARARAPSGRLAPSPPPKTDPVSPGRRKGWTIEKCGRSPSNGLNSSFFLSVAARPNEDQAVARSTCSSPSSFSSIPPTSEIGKTRYDRHRSPAEASRVA